MYHGQQVFRKGFALPTVLIASVVLLSILAVSISATSAIRTTLKNQYYAQLAQIAGEAGVAYAKACLAANGNVPQWSDAKPLKPSTNCSGDPLVGATVRSLVVAGGGSGGGSTAGGGGAGGMLYTESSTVAATTYPIVVGAGGAAVSYGNNTGNNGADSSFNGLVAIGGGGGGHSANSIPGTNGHDGGSGGGGQSYYSAHPPGAGTAGQGNAGGPLAFNGGTGGGGAGGVGLSPTATNGGANGGPGLQNSITGAAIFYAAGGGSGGSSAATKGIGGSGIGGDGGSASVAGAAGVANTGSGGGGGWSHAGGGGGAGGSGVVIISYPIASGISATGGTETTSGLYKIHKFTSSGDFVISSIPTLSCPVDTRCSVTINGNVRSSFSVGAPTLNSEGKAVTVPNSGYVEILRSSNGAVWRTITQPSVQAAVVSDLCTASTSAASGWNNAIQAATQDALSGASSAQSITVANTTLNAGAMYFRKDVSVTAPGTYVLRVLTPSNRDVAEVYVGSQKVATSTGSLASGSVTLSAGCQPIMIKLTNATVDPKASRVVASLQKSDSGSPIAVTDSSWRFTTGDTVHYSSPKYYTSPSDWVPIRDYTPAPANPGSAAARGITTPVAAGTGYSYYRDNRTINVTTATPISGAIACTGVCVLYLDGETIVNGVASIYNSFNVTLQPGEHTFSARLYGSGGTPYFNFAATRDSDGAVVTQTDANWSTSNVWTTAQDYYSYDASFVPTPDSRLTASVSALVVGGGGGGGTGMGGGGGGGGVIYSGSYTIRDSIDVVVGGGGAGATAGLGVNRGENGGNSQFGTLRAFGGGGGGSKYSANTYPPGSGASAGGNAAYLQTTPAVGILGQGNAGGVNGSPYYPGGGGGAGGAGTTNPGTGGIGVSNDILGTLYYWGGGGGGSGYTGIGGNGGAGGGGGGAVGVTTGGSGLNAGSPGGGGTTVAQTNKPGGNAGANTGGGGGGGSHYNATNAGGDGGSGIVVISYAVGSMTAIGGTVSCVGGSPIVVGAVTTCSAGRTVHTFLSSGTFTIVSIP